MHQNPLLVILGPTASGKTKLAVELADSLKGEIISADSRQVFKEMNIGTGKDLSEYNIHGNNIPYHLIDIKEAGERYNVNEFKEDFYKVFEQLTNNQVLPILCGGTGMYIHSILQNHDYTAVPVNGALRDSLKIVDLNTLKNILQKYPVKFTIHADQSSQKRMIRAIEIAEYLKNHTLIKVKRPAINPFVIGLSPDIELRRSKVIKRLTLRFKEGMIEEVQRLLQNGVSKEMLTFYGLEYKFITAYLFNEISLSALKEKLSIAICQFARRQMTFFRKMEKDGVKIHWFDVLENQDELFREVLSLYLKEYNNL